MKRSENKSLEVQPDYKELFACLNGRNVRYVVVGAHALAFHGVVRFTGDLDVLIQSTIANAERTVAAMNDFGFGGTDIKLQDFLTPDYVIQLGYPPLRIDLITGISGVTWAQAWRGRKAYQYGGIAIPVLGLSQLVRNKRASGRAKDLADVAALLSKTTGTSGKAGSPARSPRKRRQT